MFCFITEPQTLKWTRAGEPFAACVRPGNTLTFQWEGTWHNVEQVDEEGYENCSGFSNTEGVEGPYVFKAEEEGKFYFVCGVCFICYELVTDQCFIFRFMVTVLQENRKQLLLSAETVELNSSSAVYS